MTEYDFVLHMEVRDYELDIQGIVNNSVYLNYLEHCRHRYITTIGIDFTQLHSEGLDPVVTRAEIDYRRSLRSNEKFFIGLKLSHEGRLRHIFHQEIVRVQDSEIICKAKVTTTILKDGQPVPLPDLQVAAENHRKEGLPS